MKAVTTVFLVIIVVISACTVSAEPVNNVLNTKIEKEK